MDTIETDDMKPVPNSIATAKKIKTFPENVTVKKNKVNSKNEVLHNKGIWNFDE